MVGDAADNNGADGPEHLEHLGGGSTQLQGHDLTAVRGCVTDEDTPRYALEQLSDEHDGEGFAEEEDEDEGVQGHETKDGGPAVSDLAGDGSGEEDTHEGAERPTHLKGGLPAGGDDLLACGRVDDAKIVGKGGQGNEVAHEEHTVGLHDLKSRSATVVIYSFSSLLIIKVEMETANSR